MKKIALISCFSFSVLMLNAQQYSEQQIQNMFTQRPEVYIEIDVTNGPSLNQLTNMVSIDHGQQGNVVKAYANKKEIANLVDQGIHFTLLQHPSVNRNLPMMLDGSPQFLRSQVRAFTAYPTYPQYEALMQQYANDYPSLCKYYELGTLPSGRKIMLLKVSANVNVRENEPQFLYTSTMHGDETTGYPMLLSFVEHLLSGYGSDPAVDYLMNNVELWVCPDANPDGTYAGGNTTVNGATRANANGVDLNRNYPDPQDGLHPDGNAYQPETILFMGLADTTDFVMAANFHGGAEVVNYPWDTWAHTHPDLNWWLRESVDYATLAQNNSPSGYMTDVYGGTSNPGVTNGYAWYEVNGGRQDFMNWWHHCREYTIELSTQKTLSASQLDAYYGYNEAALMEYMQESTYGIRGIVTDACTGTPVKAKVYISGHDADSSHVYSSLPVGNYHRPIYQGTYNVTYSAPGYQSQTINNITVVDQQATVVDVQLQPLAPTAALAADLVGSCSGTVQFTDNSGSASTWTWYFGDGSTSSSENPVHTYASSGTYNVALKISNCAGNDSIMVMSAVNVTVSTPPTSSDVTASNCTPQSFTLSGSGSGTLQWYDAATGGNLLATGNSYTTPVLSTGTTFYVSDLNVNASQYVGKLDNSTGAGGYFTGSTYHYLIFDALSDFKLVSVWVDANSTANRTVELRDASGTVLQSATINIPAGQGRVTLNFNVPAGTGYQLGLAGGGNMYRSSSGTSYPYDIAGIVSIYGNSANNNNYYYYYYDWEIQTFCESATIPVSANFPAGSPADVNISASAITICQGDQIDFSATPTNGGTTPAYNWEVNGNNAGTGTTYSSSGLNNGDVVTCVMTSSDACATNNPASSNSISVTVNSLPATPTITQAGNVLYSSATSGNQWYLDGNPIAGATADTLVASADGVYTVMVTDGNNCSSALSNAVTVSSAGVSEMSQQQLHIYPNPATENVMISWNNNVQNAQLQIYDNAGRLVCTEYFSGINANVDISRLAKGIYTLRVLSGQNLLHARMIKQ